MVEVSNNFIQECEANVGTYKFGKIKVNYIDDNPLNYEQGAYSSTNGTKIDATQSVRYNKLVECEPNFKYKIELGNSAIKMKIITYTEAQAFIAAHDNLVDGNELTTEATARYISVTIYSNDTLEGTAITLNNTIKNGEIAGVELKGNTTQNGTPTPTSPIEVNNVTGEQVVRVCGKNLYIGYDNMLEGFLPESGTYPTTNSTYPNARYFTIEVKEGESITTSQGENSNGRIRCIDKDTNRVIETVGATSTNNYYTSTAWYNNFRNGTIVAKKDFIIGVMLLSADNTPYQLERGSQATTYEPYQGKDYEIDLTSRNLLDYTQLATRTENGITITNNGDGTFSVNGTATADISLAINNETFVPMSGTWRMVGCPSGGSSSTYMLSAYVGYWGGGSPNIDTGNGTSITYTGNVKVRFYIKSGTTCNNLLFKPMVTYDLNATYEDFAPYFEPIELNKIGNYQDKIVKNNGKWYLEKNIQKSELKNLTWATHLYGTNSYQSLVSGIKAEDTSVMVLSNVFKGIAHKDRGSATNTVYVTGIVGGYGIVIRNTSYTSLTDFTNMLTSTNAIGYYVLATPTYTLIENEELIEQLDAVSHAETQEGITNIMTTGDLPAILDVMPDLTESIRGKQTTPIVGYNITGDDDLINFKITSKADSNGNILGATSQSQVDIEIFNENNTHNLENKQVYISTGLAETEGNYCKWQPFIITQTKDTQTKNHTTYTGYDDMMRGNEAYIDNIDYGEDGITLYDFTCNLAKEMGMALGNTTMTNGDFIVKGNNFTNNETKLVVLKNVAQMVGGFAMIDRDNLLRIVELSPEDAMTPIELTTNLYTEDFQNSAKFGEINEIAIGETNLETNAIVRSDEEAIAKDGVKKIEILDNLFLGMLADKELAIDPLWDAFEGFNYYPFKTQYNGYPYIDLGDKLNITDINNNTYNSFIFNYVFEYNGGYKGNVGAEALSVTAAKYKTNNTLGKQFRKVGIEIDRVEGKITQEVNAMSQDLTTAYSGAIETSEENIMGQVKTIQTTLYGPTEHPEEGLEKIVATHSSQIDATSQFVNIDIKNKLDTTYNMADAVTNNTKEIVESFNFNENGMLITNKGTETSDMALLVSNSAITFKYRGNDVLVINGEKIEFSAVSFKKLDLGNYVWQAEQDDSLSLIYEGGNT